MRAGAHRESNFFFINIGHYAAFDGLSESEIKISDGTTWDQKMVKIQNGKKWQKKILQKNRSGCRQYFNSCRSILHPNEKFLETKMIREKRSTNPLSWRQFGRGHCNRGRDPMEIPS